jgi:hypothetical protein
MYFTANSGNGFHIWREPFPEGVTEQVTSGVTQEEGIAFAPDGGSFITSIGVSQSEVWFHDSRGDRQITSEGYALLPSVSPDGNKLYYLLRAEGPRYFLGGELWVADLESDHRQRLLPDFPMQQYSISPDGRRLVFVSADASGHSPVWLWDLDGRSAPRQATTLDAFAAYLSTDGYVTFAVDGTEGKFIGRAKEDGSEHRKIVPVNSSSSLVGTSPDGRWIVGPGPTRETSQETMLYPSGGGPPMLVCACTSGNGVERIEPPAVSWSPDGKFLYLKFTRSIYAIPVAPGQSIPPIPASGFRSKEDVAAVPGARLIPEPGAFPGPNPSVYAFTKISTHRNIYRIPVP